MLFLNIDSSLSFLCFFAFFKLDIYSLMSVYAISQMDRRQILLTGVQ